MTNWDDGPRYYVLDGTAPRRVGLMEWAQEFELVNRRRVADTWIDTDERRVRVSTVFLGLDHNHFGKGPPLIFETMVFGGQLDGEQDRYSTWDEAEAGHAAMVERVKCAKPSPA